MLNQNPGLKDITYSITGGSIKAQGALFPNRPLFLGSVLMSDCRLLDAFLLRPSHLRDLLPQHRRRSHPDFWPSVPARVHPREITRIQHHDNRPGNCGSGKKRCRYAVQITPARQPAQPAAIAKRQPPAVPSLLARPRLLPPQRRLRRTPAAEPLYGYRS